MSTQRHCRQAVLVPPIGHQFLPGEWSVCPQILHQLWQLYGAPHVDLFTREHMPAYFRLSSSRTWSQETDALSFSWTGLWAYAYPPTPLIPQVLEKVRSEECEMILTAPAWPTQPCFSALLRLLVDHPQSVPPLAIVESSMLGHGFSTVALRIARSHRQTTTSIYDSRSKDLFLKNLVSNFGIERPRSDRSLPQWDICQSSFVASCEHRLNLYAVHHSIMSHGR